MASETSDRLQSVADARKPYESPRLRDLGLLTELTRANPYGGDPDGFGGGSNPPPGDS
jgi:hypothetical protein